MSAIRYLLTGVTIIAISCSAGDEKASVPAKPQSAEQVKSALKGKTFSGVKAGTHDVFSKDSSITWLAPTDENKFEKKIVDEAISLKLQFVNDTSAIITQSGKEQPAKYSVDAEPAEDEKPGIRLRLSYADDEFRMGDGPAMEMTYNYLIEGINDTELLVETPRSMNNRKIIMLMKKQ